MRHPQRTEGPPRQLLFPQNGSEAQATIAGYLVLGVFPNLASKSQHEKRVMVPVSLLLAILAILIAIS
jgi:hypothetical protein